MVAVIDYKVGNIQSVLKMLQKIGVDCKLTSDKDIINNATHLIIPGVGHYRVGMSNLEDLGLVDVIKSQSQSKPILGICLGMQLLFNGSEEAPGVCGLGLIDGEFKRFNVSLKVPHIGWNEVYGNNKPDIFSSIDDGSNFYFVHSYHAILNEEFHIRRQTMR